MRTRHILLCLRWHYSGNEEETQEAVKRSLFKYFQIRVQNLNKKWVFRVICENCRRSSWTCKLEDQCYRKNLQVTVPYPLLPSCSHIEDMEIDMLLTEMMNRKDHAWYQEWIKWPWESPSTFEKKIRNCLLAKHNRKVSEHVEVVGHFLVCRAVLQTTAVYFQFIV